MRINMRELEQMLRVDVRVQINPGLRGSVSPSLPTTWCPGILVHLFIPSASNDALSSHPVLITNTLFMFTGQNSNHPHDGGPERGALGI